MQQEMPCVNQSKYVADDYKRGRARWNDPNDMISARSAKKAHNGRQGHPDIQHFFNQRVTSTHATYMFVKTGALRPNHCNITITTICSAYVCITAVPHTRRRPSAMVDSL